MLYENFRVNVHQYYKHFKPHGDRPYQGGISDGILILFGFVLFSYQTFHVESYFALCTKVFSVLVAIKISPFVEETQRELAYTLFAHFFVYLADVTFCFFFFFVFFFGGWGFSLPRCVSGWLRFATEAHHGFFHIAFYI